ncbi:MAG: hypothetical protein QNJ54_04905 [Prochloraceae cyanobacterium]|nr:hypothetical protein [Prochloraceae cyanobacterium]
MNLYFLLEIHETVSHTISPFLKLLYIFFTIALALLHIFIGKLNWIEKILPKSRWLSLAAGVSLAYVFLEVLPELNKAQTEIEHYGGAVVQYLEKHIYILALVGLTVFYGLEILVQKSCRLNREAGREDCTSMNVFWIHIGSFAIYNILIGDLLNNTEKNGLVNAILLCIALALHFLINDHSLRIHHKRSYDKIGRWILAGALVLGWIMAEAVYLNEAFIAILWGLVAGGIILNVLKEELPESKQSCFWSFTFGTVIYSALILAIS